MAVKVRKRGRIKSKIKILIDLIAVVAGQKEPEMIGTGRRAMIGRLKTEMGRGVVIERLKKESGKRAAIERLRIETGKGAVIERPKIETGRRAVIGRLKIEKKKGKSENLNAKAGTFYFYHIRFIFSFHVLDMLSLHKCFLALLIDWH